MKLLTFPTVDLEALGEFRILTLRELPPGELPAGACPEDIENYFKTAIAIDVRFNPDVESFFCLVVNTRRRIQGHFLVAHGTLDTILVHAREVFRPAIVANAGALVLLHNHPSGDPTPSEADIKITRELMRGGQLLKIEVLDHLIIGRANTERPKGYCSLRELGYFYQ